MGFFSWLTADTKESVIVNSRRRAYLLQPNGQKPIIAKRYDGFGSFGDTDAFSWCAKANIAPDIIKTMTDSEIYGAGVALSMGNYYEDVNTKEKFAIFHGPYRGLEPHIDKRIDNYETPLSQYDNQTPNQLIRQGIFVARKYACKFPIKISYNPNAVYEDLPASEDCPNQGMS